MKNINELLTNKKLCSITDSFNYQSPFVDPLRDDKTAAVVNEIFEKLEYIFSGFNHAWPDERIIAGAKKEWLRAFIEAELFDIATINIGLSALRRLESNFPPSPGQFIALCQNNTPKKEIKPTANTMNWNLLKNWKVKTDEELTRISNVREAEMEKMRAMLGIKTKA